MVLLSREIRKRTEPSEYGSAAKTRNFRVTSSHNHPLLDGPQTIMGNMAMRVSSKACLTEFTQRVMSGKLLQLRKYQSQLVDTQKQLYQARDENKALNRLLKRLEISLQRYEGEKAEMPRLLRSHAEEVRVLRANVHQLKGELHHVQNLLKEKDYQVVQLKDSLNKLRTMAHEGSLFDQYKAQEKMRNMENLLEEQNREIQMLNRRLLLESKTNGRLLTNEEVKRRDTQKQLEVALKTIQHLEQQKRTILMGYTPSPHHNCQPLHTEACCEKPKMGSRVPSSRASAASNPRRGVGVERLLPFMRTITPSALSKSPSTIRIDTASSGRNISNSIQKETLPSQAHG